MTYVEATLLALMAACAIGFTAWGMITLLRADG